MRRITCTIGICLSAVLAACDERSEGEPAWLETLSNPRAMAELSTGSVSEIQQREKTLYSEIVEDPSHVPLLRTRIPFADQDLIWGLSLVLLDLALKTKSCEYVELNQLCIQRSTELWQPDTRPSPFGNLYRTHTVFATNDYGPFPPCFGLTQSNTEALQAAARQRSSHQGVLGWAERLLGDDAPIMLTERQRTAIISIRDVALESKQKFD